MLQHFRNCQYYYYYYYISISPEPAVGISATTVRTEAQLWATKEHLRAWKTISTCRQAKLLVNGPDRQLTRSVLKFNRRDIKVLVGLLTGHITLNRHLSVMKLHNDPLCPACGEEEETTYHFLATCPALMQDRYSIFGSHLLRNEELHKVQPISLIRFARTTKRLM